MRALKQARWLLTQSREARRRTVWDLAQAGDLLGFSAVLFGDAASGKRRDLAKAA